MVTVARKTKAQPSKSVAPAVKASRLRQTSGVSINVVDTSGKKAGTVTLPVELFGASANDALLAQAIRVYQTNQRAGTASTKTRGEVEGSTRKIYRQKGTGRARHGAIRAPIFVGGGIVFGPKPHSFRKKLPVAMRRRALACALTQQYKDGNTVVVDGLEEAKKTKTMGKALSLLAKRSPVLLVTPKEAPTVVRTSRNLAKVDTLPASQLHAYVVLSHGTIILMKSAVPLLKETFVKN